MDTKNLPASPLLALNSLRTAGRDLLSVSDLRGLGLARNRRTLVKRMQEMGCIRRGRTLLVTLAALEQWLQNHYQPGAAERATAMLSTTPIKPTKRVSKNPRR